MTQGGVPAAPAGTNTTLVRVFSCPFFEAGSTKMATGITFYSSDTCKLPGCSNPKYRERNGLQHDFCGRTHAQQYKQLYGYTPPPPSYYGTSVSSHKKKSKPMKAIHNLVSSLPSSLTSSSRFSSSTKSAGEPIKFYNRGEPYYEFTNFYPAAVIIDEQRWPSTEHYFQAQKFVGTPYLDIVRELPSARDAFQLSRNPTVSQWRRSDWDAVKDDIMLKALRCKFAQHTDLMNLLWETGEREIIEHTTNDSYWADGGGPGRGQNKLGKLLMQVRDDIAAVRGKYKPSKKVQSSKNVSKPSKLKRSSSFSDISGVGRAAKDSNLSFEQSTVVAPKKPALRRSNSFSKLSQVSNDTSKSSTISRHPRDTSRIRDILFSPKKTGSFYSRSSSSRQTTLNEYIPTLSKQGTSSRSAKGTAKPPSYSSAVKRSLHPVRPRPGESGVSPITHQPLPYYYHSKV